MSSVNFNNAATQALRTLQVSNSQLDATQNRISTGLKISEAKDNAAYWSISTTLKSDNKAMGTVKDALGLGAATVDTAYQGLNEALNVLDQIKSKLTAATQAGVDRSAVQAEIKALQDQLSSIANAATFSGENWLSISTTGYDTKTVVSSVIRQADSTVSVGTINVSLSGINLIGSGAAKGSLDSSYNVEKAFATLTTTADTTFATNETSGFTINVNGTGDKAVSITYSDVNAALGVNTGVVTQANFAKVLNWKFASMGISNVTAVQNGNAVELTAYSADKTAGANNDASVVISAVTGTAGRNTDLGVAAVNDAANTKSTLNVNALNMTVSDAALTGLGATTEAQKQALIGAYISSVNVAIGKVTTAASKLGAISARIELQKDFVTNLMDTIDKGVSGLVDADMNEESTKLQALQVKQSLGVQALSIANQSAQNVLRLFQ